MQIAAALAASYVGGSLNFAATASALNLAPGSLMASAMAADNVAMAFYLAIISSWPVRKLMDVTDSSAAESTNGTEGTSGTDGTSPHAHQLATPSIMLQDDMTAAAPMQSDASKGVSGIIRSRRSNAVDSTATVPPATNSVQQRMKAVCGRWGSLAAAVPAAAAACASGRAVAKTIGFAGGDLAFMALVAVALAAVATAVVRHQSPPASSVSSSPFVGELTFFACFTRAYATRWTPSSPCASVRA